MRVRPMRQVPTPTRRLRRRRAAGTGRTTEPSLEPRWISRRPSPGAGAFVFLQAWARPVRTARRVFACIDTGAASMDLIASARNPAPSGAVTGTIETSDGIRLRVARWEATVAPQRGTVCLFQGRTEFIEKYFETIADLRRRGFAVATLDWRGQGLSQRLVDNPAKGHVRSFRDFDRDLDAFMRQVVEPNCKPPYYA